MAPDLSSEVGWLLTDLCEKLGFSMAIRDPDRFQELVPLGPDQFADAVLDAEGLNPDHEKQVRRHVRELVAARFARWKETGAA